MGTNEYEFVSALGGHQRSNLGPLLFIFINHTLANLTWQPLANTDSLKILSNIIYVFDVGEVLA